MTVHHEADGWSPEPPEGTSRFRTLTVAWKLVWSTGRRLLTFIVAAMAVAAIALALQLLVGRELVELLADEGDIGLGDLAPSVVLLGLLLVIASTAESVTRELRLPLSELVERRATEDILDVASSVDYESYEYPGFHDRLERALRGAGEESASVVFGVVSVLSTLMITAGLTAVLLSVVPVLVVVAVVGYVPVTVVNLINNRAMYQLEFDLTENDRERTYYEDVLTMRGDAKELRSFGFAALIRKWYGRLWVDRLHLIRAVVRRRLVLSLAGSAISTLVLVGTLGFTLYLASQGSISLGDAAVAVIGLQQLSTRLVGVGSALSSVHEAVIFLRDFEHFRDGLVVDQPHEDVDVVAAPDRIVVQGLGYRYPGSERDALGSVDLELQRGQIMAIVGSNGSGKSTLAKILAGLLPASRGSIAWDGTDVTDAKLARLRPNIAPVFQDYSRLNVELGQAVGMGNPDRIGDEVAIDETLRRVGLDKLIDQDGLGVRLGKEFSEGIDLSIGQWQRVAIARALFRDASLLIFDEPSASLDPHAEAELFELLHEIGADKTVVFISHRFATVRHADVVVVLDDGALVEQGSHDELMTLGGLYAEMFSLQADRFG